jgi:hypothetical protein
MSMLIQVIAIAMAAHEINRAYCLALGDDTQPAWAGAPQWQKDSAVAGVNMHLANPDATPEQSHESWLAQKLADGWIYGPVKDADAKQHPCCVPYAELPLEQKAKDYLFRATVHALAAIDKALPRPQPVVQGEVVAIKGVTVSYIGRRESWLDNQYGTGLSFVVGQSRTVPGDVAAKLLRHQDLFELSGMTDLGADDTADLLNTANSSKTQEQEATNRRFNLLADVMNMNKQSLTDFAFMHYQQKLNNRDAVADLRSQVAGLIDQYGIS